MTFSAIFQIFSAAIGFAVVTASAFAKGAEISSGREAFDTAAAQRRVDAYHKRIMALRRQAFATGSLCYEDVIEAAYGNKASALAYSREKGLWRERHRERLEIASDYSKVDISVPIVQRRAIANRTHGGQTVALYEARKHVVEISAAASEFAVLHEVGHSLQRGLLAQGNHPLAGLAASTIFGVPLKESKPRSRNARDLRRLAYLGDRVEFEVRLQDLNRFYANVVGDGPISHPRQALHALSLLGLTIEVGTEASLLSQSRESLSIMERQEKNSALIASSLTYPFSDAKDLVALCELAKRCLPDLQGVLLSQILMEAPGHL